MSDTEASDQPEAQPITMYCGKERRKDWHTPDNCPQSIGTHAAMEEINRRLDAGSARMSSIEATIAANHKLASEDRKRQEAKQDANNADTAELLEIIRMGKGLFRGVAWLGKWFRKIVMWVLPLATAILSFWWALTGHTPPK